MAFHSVSARGRAALLIAFVAGAAAGAQFPAVFPAHPRLAFRPAAQRGFGRSFEDVRRLYRNDTVFRRIIDRALSADIGAQGPAALAALWVVSGQDRYAEAAVAGLVDGRITQSGNGSYSNVWSYALAYDWLYGHPALTPEKRARAARSIAERLETELAGLDDRGMAMWHGRNQAANGAVVAALAIADLPGGGPALARAMAHYAEALRALRLSEGWPEGASYWIYNRAGPYAVAADCVLTALGVESVEGIPIRETMGRIGFWSLYQFAPNQVFEPYGDSAGSLKLGETGWWEVTVDYFARLSRNPALMAGADYLRNRSPVPYGKRPYQWYAALSYDPATRPRGGYDPVHPELWMRRHLPQAMLFGRDSLGIAFFRGLWGDRDELYATFKAGDLLAHHDHYDTGHFAIQRGGFLAPRTGLYGPGGYEGRHRLGYAIQTVSSNSLLVLAPGETSRDLRSRKDPVWTALSGGQRVIRATGFDCFSVAHFEKLRDSGPHLERANITAFESVPRRYDYIAADITAAYNSTRWSEPGNEAKVSLATRQFLYLRDEEAFLIYDRVETTSPRYLPKFLLHALSKPRSETERLLAGNGPDDGILETRDRRFTTAHQRGVLTQVVLLPASARTLKIGGPHYNCYVESSGDQSAGFKGVNLEGGDPLAPRETAQLGLWRTELEPAEPSTSTRFLNVLVPRLAAGSRPVPEIALEETGAGSYAVRVGGSVVVVARDSRPIREFAVNPARGTDYILLDAVPGAVYRAGRRTGTASREGVLRLRLPAGRHEVSIFSSKNEPEERI